MLKHILVLLSHFCRWGLDWVKLAVDGREAVCALWFMATYLPVCLHLTIRMTLRTGMKGAPVYMCTYKIPLMVQVPHCPPKPSALSHTGLLLPINRPTRLSPTPHTHATHPSLALAGLYILTLICTLKLPNFSYFFKLEIYSIILCVNLTIQKSG